jgi:ParB family chromosome partitioning protein
MMNFLRNMTVVNSERICRDDETFRISSPWLPPSAQLVTSIRQVGLLAPLWIESQDDGRFRIVSGFRRFAALSRLQVDRIPASLVEGPPETLLRAAVHENMTGRTLSGNEAARVVVKFREVAGYSEHRLIEDVLPLLGLPASTYQLRRLEKLARLPVILQRALDDKLTEQSALRLAEWPAAEQNFLTEKIIGYRLGPNKQKELLDLLEDLRYSYRQPLESLWRECGCQAVEETEGLAPADRYTRLRDLLWERRYPTLTAFRQRARELLQALELPPEIRIELPPNLEGDKLTVNLQGRSPERLRELLKSLEHSLEREAWLRLFELL